MFYGMGSGSGDTNGWSFEPVDQILLVSINIWSFEPPTLIPLLSDYL